MLGGLVAEDGDEELDGFHLGAFGGAARGGSLCSGAQLGDLLFELGQPPDLGGDLYYAVSGLHELRKQLLQLVSFRLYTVNVSLVHLDNLH